MIIYSRDMRKWTPLHYAAYNGHHKAVNFLLRWEADQDELHLKRNSQKKTAFIIAKNDWSNKLLTTFIKPQKMVNLTGCECS